MNILYLNRQTDWDCNELRYSLRSLAMYGKNVGKVIVCGYCPSWLSGEVIKLPCNNPFDRKAKNITHRVLYALKWLKNKGYGQDCLLSSDDIFHLREFDAEKYPYFIKNGAEIGLPEEYKGTKIYNIIADAREFMVRYGLPTIDYGGGHALHHIDGGLLDMNAALIRKAQDSKYGIPFDLLMGALIAESNTQIDWQVRADIKCETLAELQATIRSTDIDCFSVDDGAVAEDGRELMENKYHDKSIYEL